MTPRTRGPSLLPLLCLLVACLALLGPAAAVQKSLAGVIDWHKPNIGIPRADIQPVLSGGRVVVVTRSGVVAALDEQSGNINWRTRLEGEDERISSVHVQDSDVLVVSMPTGQGSSAVIRSLSPVTGHLQWETQLPSSSDAHSGPSSTARYVASAGSQAGRWLLVLDGARVISLDGEDGSVQWEYVAVGSESGLNGQIVDIATTSSRVHVIAALNSLKNHQLGHLALDIASGAVQGSDNGFKALDGTVIPGPSQLLVTRNATLDEAKLHYLAEDRTLRCISLGNDGSAGQSAKAASSSGASAYTQLLPLGLQGKGYFLAATDESGGDVISAREKGSTVLFNFDGDARQQRSSAIWNGHVGPDGGAYITRLFWSHGLGLANLHIYNIDHPDGYVYTGKTIPYQDAEHGVILDSAVAIKSSLPIVDTFSAVLVTSTGALQYWREQELVWTREESLAEIKAVKMVELPEKKSEEVVQVLREDEGIAGRLVRQSKALGSLPSFVAGFAARFLGGTYTKALSSTPLSLDNLHRDAFGFQKLLVVATSTGKIFALDSAHGNILWSRLLGTSTGPESTLDVRGIWNVRGFEKLETPVLAIIAVDSSKRQAESGRGGAYPEVGTVAFHLDAFTGLEVGSRSSATSGPLTGRQMFPGEPSRIFPLPVEHCKTHIRALAVASREDTVGQIHLFPFCKKIEAGLKNISSHLHLSSVHIDPLGSALQGLNIAGRAQDGVFTLVPSYRHLLPLGSRVQSISRPSTAPIASLGRVLGDRSALYKYLNPHLMAIASIQASTSSALLQVVDESSGRLIYSANITRVNNDGLQVALAENWLVYSWTDADDPMEGGCAHHLVSVELFESGKSKSSETSSYGGEQEVEAIAKTFVTSSAIRALGISTSLQGITSKDLIYIDDRGQLNTLTRRLLDPRRPAGPPSKMDKEEMLIPFNPLLPADSRRVVSHEAEVLGLAAIHAAPTLLESTGIILATGLDLFSTRIQPSGTFDILSDAFNKVQLVLTIAGLGVGIAIARPAVNRKTLRARWY